MIYMNQAATTYPKPQCVLEVHTASLHTMPEGQFRSDLCTTGESILEQCRKNIGKLLGISEYDRIYFSCGATDSSNAVIYGLPLAGKHVVTTQTEHNSILRPLMNLKDRVGSVTIVPCNEYGKVDIEKLEESVTKETAAIFVNHCSNVTGMVQDLKKIGKIAEEKGVLFVVDASQSAGCIPIDVDAWNIDVLIFTGHKSLFGAQGTGGYYVRGGGEFRPYRYGGTGRNSSQLTYENGDYEYETGTQNSTGISALNAGVKYILERGVETIAEKERVMMKRIYEELGAIKNVKVYGTYEENYGPVVSFNISGMNPSDVAYILQNCYDIIVRTGLQCAPLIHEALGTEEKGTVRVSISDMTSENEVESLLAALKEITASVEVQM